MKVRLMLFAICGLIFISCSHGQLSTLPEIEQPGDVAEVFIIRRSAIAGAAVSYKISLDDQDIVMLKNGSHTRFKVSAGPHQLSWKFFNLVWGWRGTTHDFDFAANEKYYLLLKSGLASTQFKKITEDEATKYLKKTEYLELDQ